jgi:hypothetical protein
MLTRSAYIERNTETVRPGSVAVLQRGIAVSYLVKWLTLKEGKNLRGLSSLANYTD